MITGNQWSRINHSTTDVEKWWESTSVYHCWLKYICDNCIFHQQFKPMGNRKIKMNYHYENTYTFITVIPNMSRTFTSFLIHRKLFFYYLFLCFFIFAETATTKDSLRQSFSQCYSCTSERKDHLKYWKEKKRERFSHSYISTELLYSHARP